MILPGMDIFKHNINIILTSYSPRFTHYKSLMVFELCNEDGKVSHCKVRAIFVLIQLNPYVISLKSK